jgi:hypothetical protein
LFGERRKEPAPEEKPREPEVVKPEAEPVRSPAAEQPISTPKPSDFVGEDFGKRGVRIEKPALTSSRLSEHGEFSAQTREVLIDDLQSTVENPLVVLRQSAGRIFYLSDKAVVVLDREGAVVTTYPASKFDTAITALLDRAYLKRWTMSPVDRTQRVRAILLKDWDPLIVGDNPHLSDEYDDFSGYPSPARRSLHG